jgi:hypothetical protein
MIQESFSHSSRAAETASPSAFGAALFSWFSCLGQRWDMGLTPLGGSL